MAEFGAKYPRFRGNDDAAAVTVGKLCVANLTVNLASGELFADDELAEQVSEFSSGSLAMETDDMLDEVAEKVYGCTVEDGEVTYNTGDVAPRGVLAYYKRLRRKGKQYFKGCFYPAVQAVLGNDNAATKGSSITFNTTQTTFTIFADDNGDWRKTHTFDTEEEAKAWVDNKVAKPAG